MKSFSALFFSMLFAGSVWASDAKPAAFKPDLNKGQAISTQVCGACHTADGSRGSPANPILQGQHADYLVKQLTEFKSGKRKNAIMAGMSATLSDEDMKHVAAFYASKTAKPGFANALTGLANAMYSEAPLLSISGSATCTNSRRLAVGDGESTVGVPVIAVRLHR